MKSIAKKIILGFTDVLAILASIYIAYLLRFDFRIPPQISRYVPYVLVGLTSLTVFFFILYKVNRTIWRYTSAGDLFPILKATVSSIIGFYLVHQYIVRSFEPDIIVPRSIYLLAGILIILFTSGLRLVWKLWNHSFSRIQPHHRKTLIFGAGEAGMMVARELRQTQSRSYPVAYADDDGNKLKHQILGIPVLGNRYDIPDIVRNYKIDEIVVAIPSASRTEIAEVINICKETGCQIKIMPKMEDLINGKLSINMIRDVSLEDLLGREPVIVELEEISGYLRYKTVLVTGAGGSIGSELCRQVASFQPKRLILLGHGENSIYQIELELRKKHSKLEIIPVIADIQDLSRLREIFQVYRPEVVFHAAAHKHVPLMERNPKEAIKNNVLGTQNVALCAHEFESERFVLISTDKAVNPTSVMGATKRIAEMIVQSLNAMSKTKFAAVRFGNVLGSRGSVIPLFKQQIEEGGPVTVTHPEMMRYFMTIPEAVQLVIQAGAFAEGGEVFILDMGKPVKIVDLARDVIRLSGLEPDVDIKIEFTGIRPGEKLFEELFTQEEGAVATKHDRIYVGLPCNLSYDSIQSMVQQLAQLTDKNEICKALKQIVPSYQPMDVKELEASFQEAKQASLEIVAALDLKSN